MKRSAMHRGTGFKRPERVRQPMAPLKPIRRGVVSRCDALAPVQPKTEPKRNPHLLAMAKGQRCLLMVPGVCNRNPETVVAAHSNLSIHGKAKGRKADDQYHIYACSACHEWLDSGPWPRKIKEEAFMAAHNRQVMAWLLWAAGPEGRGQRAAAWALDELGNDQNL